MARKRKAKEVESETLSAGDIIPFLLSKMDGMPDVKREIQKLKKHFKFLKFSAKDTRPVVVALVLSAIFTMAYGALTSGGAGGDRVGQLDKRVSEIDAKYSQQITNINLRQGRGEDQARSLGDQINQANAKIDGVPRAMEGQVRAWLDNDRRGMQEYVQAGFDVMKYSMGPAKGRSMTFAIPKDKFETLRRFFNEAEYEVTGPREPASAGDTFNVTVRRK